EALGLPPLEHAHEMAKHAPMISLEIPLPRIMDLVPFFSRRCPHGGKAIGQSNHRARFDALHGCRRARPSGLVSSDPSGGTNERLSAEQKVASPEDAASPQR